MGHVLEGELQELQEKELRNLLSDSGSLSLKIQFFKMLDLIDPADIGELVNGQPIPRRISEKYKQKFITQEMIQNYVTALNDFYDDIEDDADRPVEQPITLSRVLVNVKLYKLLAGVEAKDRRRVVVDAIRKKATEIGAPLAQPTEAAACEFIEFKLTEDQATALFDDIKTKLGQSSNPKTRMALNAISADVAVDQPVQRQKTYDPGFGHFLKEMFGGAREDAKRIAETSYAERNETKPGRPLEPRERNACGGYGDLIHEGLEALRRLEGLVHKRIEEKRQANQELDPYEERFSGLADQFCERIRSRYVNGDHGLTDAQLKKRMEYALFKIATALMNERKKQDGDTPEISARRQACLSVANKIYAKEFRDIHDKANPASKEQVQAICAEAMDVYQREADEEPQQGLLARVIARVMRRFSPAAQKVQDLRAAGQKMKSTLELLEKAKLVGKSKASSELYKRVGKVARALANQERQHAYEAEGCTDLDDVLVPKDFLAQFKRHVDKAIAGENLGEETNPKRAMYVNERGVCADLLPQIEEKRLKFVDIADRAQKLLATENPHAVFGPRGTAELQSIQDRAEEKLGQLEAPQWEHCQSSERMLRAIDEATKLASRLCTGLNIHEPKLRPARPPNTPAANNNGGLGNIDPQQLQQVQRAIADAGNRPG